MREQSHQHYPDPKPLYFTEKDLTKRLQNMREAYTDIETFGTPARFSEIETAPPATTFFSF